MTLFAGALSLDPARRLPERYAQVLATQLSRHAGDRPVLQVGAGHALAQLDLGLLGGDGLRADAEGRVTLLAGEPLLARPVPVATRSADLLALHDGLAQGDDGALRASCGSFALAQVDTQRRRLQLVADKLALRPLHYAVDDQIALFASSLRMLLALAPHLAARPDLVVQAQIAGLGHPLGPGTPYAGARSVEGGQCVTLDLGGVRVRQYHDWDTIGPAVAAADGDTAGVHRAACAAVRRRLGDERRVVAHLSGGLDSRCVVALLRAAGAEVHTINYAPSGSADVVLGRDAAARLGTQHFEAAGGPSDFWARMISSHADWRRSLGPLPVPARPGRIWTGFAGESVMAPTGLSAEMLQALREGRPDAAIGAHFARLGAGLSARLFRRRLRASIVAGLHSSTRDELARRGGADPAQRLRLHVLLNEVRGNLAAHHEDLDLRRIELTLPFCDAELVAATLAQPIDALLGHRFYYRWLQDLPAAVSATAWQAYPWSEPCPIPLPPDLRTQWDGGWLGRDGARAEREQALAQITADLADPAFPDQVLDRHMLALARQLTRAGTSRYLHLFRAARVFVRYAARRPAPRS